MAREAKGTFPYERTAEELEQEAVKLENRAQNARRAARVLRKPTPDLMGKLGHRKRGRPPKKATT